MDAPITKAELDALLKPVLEQTEKLAATVKELQATIALQQTRIDDLQHQLLVQHQTASHSHPHRSSGPSFSTANAAASPPPAPVLNRVATGSSLVVERATYFEERVKDVQGTPSPTQSNARPRTKSIASTFGAPSLFSTGGSSTNLLEGIDPSSLPPSSSSSSSSNTSPSKAPATPEADNKKPKGKGPQGSPTISRAHSSPAPLVAAQVQFLNEQQKDENAENSSKDEDRPSSPKVASDSPAPAVTGPETVPVIPTIQTSLLAKDSGSTPPVASPRKKAPPPPPLYLKRNSIEEDIKKSPVSPSRGSREIPIPPPPPAKRRSQSINNNGSGSPEEPSMHHAVTTQRLDKAIQLLTSGFKGNFPDQLELCKLLNAGCPAGFVDHVVELADTQPFAQSILGRMFQFGHGVEQNLSEAMYWLNLAANKEDALALNNLGVMHLIGMGVPQNYQEAATWLTRAAKRNVPTAQYNLGLLYLDGLGVSADPVLAFHWLTQAADQDDVDALYRLGSLYRKGHSLQFPPDIKKSAQCYKRAAELGNPESQYNIALMHKEGIGAVMSATEAAKWFRAAGEQGIVEAQLALGTMHLEAEGIEQDNNQAVYWFQRAADHGNAAAQCNLGFMYRHGRGVPQSDSEAAKWYIKAAKQGNATAQKNLGNMYLYGRGVHQNDAKAVRWYREAADQNDMAAQYNLGLMYDSGTGVEQDDRSAFLWFEKAARQGFTDAQYVVGSMYEQGRGTGKQCYETAKGWYKVAAIEGKDPAAQYALGVLYEEGKGVRQNKAEATKWFKAAAEQEYAPALVKVAQALLEADNAQHNYDTALRMLRMATADDNIEAQTLLGKLLSNPKCPQFNLQEAERWLVKTVEDNDLPHAELDLARFYLANATTPVNTGIPASPRGSAASPRGSGGASSAPSFTVTNAAFLSKGVTWLTKAATAHKLPSAITELAQLFLEGKGVKRDVDQALTLLRQAADLGDAAALHQLGVFYKEGIHVALNYGDALHYLTVAASDHSHRPSQIALVGMYRSGLGVDASEEKATYWLSKYNSSPHSS